MIYPESITPFDAIKMAIEHEKRSMEFYQKAAQKAEDPGTKKMFEGMAKEEEEHLRTLEEELDRELYKED